MPCKNNVVLLLLLTIFIVSCQEPYHPDLGEVQKALVVDAKITNNPGPYLVTLKNSKSFDSSGYFSGVSGAEVYITDQYGNVFPFFEQNNLKGFYNSPEWFHAMEGNTYTLFITTPDQSRYESTPQTLLPLLPLDTLFATKGVQTEFEEKGAGAKAPVSVTGANLFVDIAEDPAQSPQTYRIESISYIQYMKEVESIMGPIYLYCWRKKFSNDILLTGSEFKVNAPELRSQKAGFMPLAQKHYNLDQNEFLTNYGAIINLHRLNPDTYQFYQQVKKLLEAEGKLFDPVPSQIKGNIRCVTSPEKLVLGFFEASSVGVFGYHLESGPEDAVPVFRPVPNLETAIGVNNCSNEVPFHWID